MGGHPVAFSRSRRPHLDRALTPSGCRMWVDTVSLGKVARSTTNTRYPCRASNIAAGEPAQRAPTTIAANFLFILNSASSPELRPTPLCPWLGIFDFRTRSSTTAWFKIYAHGGIKSLPEFRVSLQRGPRRWVSSNGVTNGRLVRGAE